MMTTAIEVTLIFAAVFIIVFILIYYWKKKPKWAAIIGVIVAAIAAIIWWIRKIVGTLAVTVATNKTLYTKGETVSITGTVKIGTSGVAGETVALAVSPPSGDAYSLPSVTTDASGNFTASWTVPSTAVDGSYTLTATSRGVSKTATFTLIHL